MFGRHCCVLIGIVSLSILVHSPFSFLENEVWFLRSRRINGGDAEIPCKSRDGIVFPSAADD